MVIDFSVNKLDDKSNNYFWLNGLLYLLNIK